MLMPDQLRAFAHDDFVGEQLDAFVALFPVRTGLIVDMGGGIGHFARALPSRIPTLRATVIDMDPLAIARCAGMGTPAELGDAVTYAPRPEQDGACFNLVLHHIVGVTESETKRLQIAALRRWRGSPVFVNEYVYDSFFGDASGRLIYAITSSQALSRLCRIVSAALPALRANTFSVGVRFRSRTAWIDLFVAAGFEVVASKYGSEELVRLPRRLLLIRSIRRDSFVLQLSVND